MKNILTLTLLGSLLCVSTYAKCTRNADETVTCSESKLMWQDDESAKTVEKTWSDAIKHCEDLIFAGYSDWRLPNKNELLSIVDYTKYEPAINDAFKNTTTSSHYYWSSTAYAFSTVNAWNVDFDDGYTIYNFKNDGSYVRCVRAGQ